MLLSHHPPCQIDRTYTLLGIRLCVRCSGIVLGTLLALLIFSFVSIEPLLKLLVGLILPLPAILNFTLHELGRIENKNYLRFFTGLALGVSIGIASSCLLKNSIIISLAIYIWIIFLEFIVAIILYKANVLEKFIEEYERGIYI